VTEAPAAGGLLESPWSGLVAAARAQSLESITREHDALFGGVGKPEVYLFGSHYLSGFLNEKPLAALRTELAALGLARDEAMPETEDHVAYLCEVMRYLIAGDDVEVANLTRQREFFARHLQPWVPLMCEAIAHTPRRVFTRRWRPSRKPSSAWRRKASTCWPEGLGKFSQIETALGRPAPRGRAAINMRAYRFP
jgi:hypothetical protein